MSMVYRLYDREGVLLYVGVTDNWIQRQQGHRASKAWWEQVHDHRLRQYKSRAAALRAEAKAICDEKPRYNVAGRWPSSRQRKAPSPRRTPVNQFAIGSVYYPPATTSETATVSVTVSATQTMEEGQ